MSGYDNHRTIVIPLPQLPQHGNSIHARHSHIGDDATASGRWTRIDERDSRFVSASTTKPFRLQQKSKRIPFRLIVVDDANNFFARHAAAGTV